MNKLKNDILAPTIFGLLIAFMFYGLAIYCLEPAKIEPETVQAMEVRSVSAPVTEPIAERITEDKPELVSLGKFKITYYCPCKKCCGKADGITKTGAIATPNKTVAVDPKVIPLGSTVYINQQPYIAEDIGGAIKGRKIDVFVEGHKEALKLGVDYLEVFKGANP